MGRHPKDRDRSELAELLLALAALAAKLRDDLAALQTLPENERPRAAREACELAYRLVYLEDVEPVEVGLERPFGLEVLDGKDHEELYELAWGVSWLALDLGQHLAFVEPDEARYREDPELRAICEDAWRRAHEMAEELADYPVADLRQRVTPGLAVFSERGLESWTR